MSAHEAPGWWGKLSTLGDFAHRRLPDEFIETSDAWLSRIMSACPAQLGDRWPDAYLNAPVLRFAWAPGIVGAGWWFGLLMPSCDNVGRYFPLLIAQRRAQPPQDRIALDHLDAWFGQLARAATHTLANGTSVDAFEQALHDAPPWPTPGAPEPLQPLSLLGGKHYQLGPRQATLMGWMHALAINELQSRFTGCSLWWRPGAAGRADACVVHGLPAPEAFADMLAGY